MTQKRLRQEDLAMLIKKTPTTVNNYLTGKSKIDIDTFVLIAKSLEVSISYFFDENPQAPKINVTHNGSGHVIGKLDNLNDARHEIEILKKEIENLKDKVKLKDEIIELLKKGK
jgi:transcriptional regulator with XRE-family HTH domain